MNRVHLGALDLCVAAASAFDVVTGPVHRDMNGAMNGVSGCEVSASPMHKLGASVMAMATMTAAARVLLVEDYDDAREMYADYLESSGFEMQQACDGPDAIRQALEHPPDIVVMDLSLPQMDGWETTRRLKTHRATADIPVVALTGNVLIDSSRRARQSGFDGFLTKPCLPEDLVAEIRRVLIARSPH